MSSDVQFDADVYYMSEISVSYLASDDICDCWLQCSSKLLPTQAHVCVCRRSLVCYTRRYFCESFVVHRASLQCNINNCLL